MNRVALDRGADSRVGLRLNQHDLRHVLQHDLGQRLVEGMALLRDLVRGHGPRRAGVPVADDAQTSGQASSTANGLGVATTRARRRPLRASSVRYSASERSRPLRLCSMLRSLRWDATSSPGRSGSTRSMSSSRLDVDIACRQLPRITLAGSSSQSWMMTERMYASPSGGTVSKKLPPTTRQRSATPDAARTAGAP